MREEAPSRISLLETQNDYNIDINHNNIIIIQVMSVLIYKYSKQCSCPFYPTRYLFYKKYEILTAF